MKYANEVLYTDVKPNEVVREISHRTIEIRAMKSELDPSWKPEIGTGGFVGHCSNNYDQQWIIESDESAPIRRIRLHRDGKWRDKHGNRYIIQDYARRFHDYNF